MLTYGIPRPESKFVSPDGNISRDWYLFLLSIFNSVGGATPVSPGSVSVTTVDDCQSTQELNDANDLGFMIPGIQAQADGLERIAFGFDEPVGSDKDSLESLSVEDAQLFAEKDLIELFAINDAFPQAFASAFSGGPVVTTTPALGSYGYTLAQATAIITAINNMRTALVANGILT